MEDGLLGGLLHLARQEELVQDHVDLVEVEDEVELAHVAEELIEQLHEEVDRLEIQQLVVRHILRAVHTHTRQGKKEGR